MTSLLFIYSKHHFICNKNSRGLSERAIGFLSKPLGWRFYERHPGFFTETVTGKLKQSDNNFGMIFNNTRIFSTFTRADLHFTEPATVLKELKENNNKLQSRLNLSKLVVSSYDPMFTELSKIINDKELSVYDKQIKIEKMKLGVIPNPNVYNSSSQATFSSLKKKNLTSFIQKKFKKTPEFEKKMFDSITISSACQKLLIPKQLLINEKLFFCIFIELVIRNKYFIYNKDTKTYVPSILQVTLINAFSNAFYELIEEELKLFFCMVFVKKHLLFFVRKHPKLRRQRKKLKKNLELFLLSMKPIYEDSIKSLKFVGLDSFSFSYLTKNQLLEYTNASEFLDDLFVFLFKKESVPNFRDSQRYQDFIHYFNYLWIPSSTNTSPNHEFYLDQPNHYCLEYKKTISLACANYLNISIIKDNSNILYTELLEESEVNWNNYSFSDSSFVLYRHKIKKQTNRFSKFYLFLPNLTLLEEIYYLHSRHKNFPMLCKPVDWHVNSAHVSQDNGGYLLNKTVKLHRLIVPFSKGSSSIKISSDAVKALNILQKKKYVINKFFLKVMKDTKALPFLKIKSLVEINKNILKYNKQVKKFITELNSKKIDFFTFIKEKPKYIAVFKSSLNKKEKYAMILVKLLKVLPRNIYLHSQPKLTLERYLKLIYLKFNMDTDVFENKYKELLELKAEITRDKLNYLLHVLQLKVAAIYKNQRYYFPSFFCFRLRNYSISSYFSRNSGIYKYLSSSRSKKAYTDRGIYWLKLGIINLLGFRKSTLVEYDILINRICPDLVKHFDPANPFKILDFIKVKLPEVKPSLKNNLVLLLYINDLYQYTKNPAYKSNLIFPIDQVASGPQILSILANCKSTLNLTNVISEDKKNDLYLDFILLFVANFNKKISTIPKYSMFKSSRLKTKLVSFFDRSFAKKFVMPRCYGMGAKGVRYRIDFELFDKNNPEIILIQKEFPQFDLFLFNQLVCSCVLFTLNSSYSILNKYFKFLKHLINILEKHNLPITFTTLDECKCTISYKYCKVKEIPRVLSTSEPTLHYIQYAFDLNLFAINNASSIVPHFIQSVDGSICRLVILEMYSKHKIHVQPVHDSFACHPNDIDKLLACLQEIYREKLIKKSSEIISENFINLNTYINHPEVKEELLNYYNNYETFKANEIKKNNPAFISTDDILKHYENVHFTFFV